jgi:hypothetical protein
MPIPMKILLRPLLLALLILTGGAHLLRSAPVASPPVGPAELDLWVRIGRTPTEIAGDIRARGLLQAPDSATLARLRAAEADPALLRWLATAEVQALVVSPEAAEQAREKRAQLAAQEAANHAAALARLNSLPARTAAAPASLPAAATDVPCVADYDAARKLALAERRCMFIVFMPADEDPNSIASHKLLEVTRQPEFQAAAKTALLCVRLACPRATDTVAANSVAARNRELMPIYHVDRLPTVWLADWNGGRVSKLLRWEENPRAFIEEFQIVLERARTRGGTKVTVPMRTASIQK